MIPYWILSLVEFFARPFGFVVMATATQGRRGADSFHLRRLYPGEPRPHRLKPAGPGHPLARR